MILGGRPLRQRVWLRAKSVSLAIIGMNYKNTHADIIAIEYSWLQSQIHHHKYLELLI